MDDETACPDFPTKKLLATADEASRNLREVFDRRSETFDPRLEVFECQPDRSQPPHYHLGRRKPWSRTYKQQMAEVYGSPTRRVVERPAGPRTPGLPRKSEP